MRVFIHASTKTSSSVKQVKEKPPESQHWQTLQLNTYKSAQSNMSFSYHLITSALFHNLVSYLPRQQKPEFTDMLNEK